MRIDDGVRAAVEDVAREVSRSVASAAGGSGRGLQVAWDALVDAMALGQPPELRACPSCGSLGMRAATRCGSCWKPLTPPSGLTGEVSA